MHQSFTSCGKAQICSAESSDHLTKAQWCRPDANQSWYENNQTMSPTHKGRYVQYRLAVGAVNGGATPRVKEISVRYGNFDGTDR